MVESTAESAGDVVDGQPTVLIVDDDEDLADTYALWLNDEYDVRTTYSGGEAMESLADDVDVVLLDRRMPAVPGDEVLGEIRDRDLDCQVAMLTAVEPDSDIVELPFDEYLVKPVSKAEVVEAVDELLFREDLDEETQEYLALNATEESLADRDVDEFRDPDAVEELREAVADAESESVRSQVEELARLKDVNALVRGVDRALVEAASREEVETQSCRRLVSEGPYEFAWIGGHVAAFDQFNPRASSEDGGLDESPVDLDESHPVTRAVEAESVVVVADPAAVADVREQDAGGGPAAVVPLINRDTVYGALVIHVGDGHAITPREEAVLGELGDSIANAIGAVESQQLLRSDTVIELDFQVDDRADALVDLGATFDAEVTLEGYAPVGDGAVTCYVTVTGAPAEDVLEWLTERDDVDNHRALDDRGDAVQIECTLSGDSVVRTLLGASANVQTLSVSGGAATVRVAVAPEADPRTVMEALESQFPGAELTAKREVERDVESTEGFRSALDEKLTERQQAVIEATYNSGYFKWPRESTAEEVAEAFDLAPPTLHEHLREAQRKLIETYLDETS